MEKLSWKVIFQFFIVLCFVMFIGIMSINNISLVEEPIRNFITDSCSFHDMTKSISDNYVSEKLWQKNGFINLNGLFARAMGRRVYNKVTLLNNGMLTYDDPKMAERSDMSKTIEGISSFSKFLMQYDIPFLYVQDPIKMDSKQLLIPDHISYYVNDNVDELLMGLTDSGVPALDLRPYLTSSIEQVERYYYRTDHHWNANGAFEAFQLILPKMEDVMGEELDKAYTNISLWDQHVLEHWFLGSHGKRVGSQFAGTDSLIWYTPVFDTSMSLIVPKHKWIYKGNFAQVNIRSQYIQKAHYFADNDYCVYIGGDYPLAEHRNAGAPNRIKVLLIKDSFALPLQAFFSTEFYSVDVIDPRYYTDSTLVQYCVYTRPDIVIMSINPSSIKNEKYYNLGSDSFQINYEERDLLLSDYNIELEANDSSYHYVNIPVKLAPGSSYRFSFHDISVTTGQTAGISVLVFNFAENKIVRQEIFDVDFCQANGGGEWSFCMPSIESDNADYQLLIYAGVHGSTKGIGITCSGIEVEKLN